MKRWKILLLLVLIAAAVVGSLTFFCLNEPKTSVSPYGTLTKEDMLDLVVDEDSVTPVSLTYHIYNRTNEELYYGVDYEIEVYRDGTWRSFDVDAAWIEIAVMLPANGNNKETIDWTNIYGELPKGSYRMIKTVNQMILWDTFTIF